MTYNAHQKSVMKDAYRHWENNIFRKAALGDKVSRHFTEELLGIGDYLESDMDGPQGLIQE